MSDEKDNMPVDNKDDLSVDDIIKEVMKKKRETLNTNASESFDKLNNTKSETSINTDDSGSAEVKIEKIDPLSNKVVKEQTRVIPNNADLNAVLKPSNRNDDGLDDQLDFVNKHTENDTGLEDIVKSVYNKKKQPEKSLPQTFKTDTNEIPLTELVAGAMKAKKDDVPSVNNAIDNSYSDANVYDVEEDIEEPKKKWSLKKKISVILCYVLGILMLICGSGVSIFSYYTGLLDRSGGLLTLIDGGQNSISDKDTVDALSAEEKLRRQLELSAANTISDNDVTNILLVGEDLRDTTEESRGNTDVMMLISINTKTEKVTMSSLMRDMYVSIPGFYEDKLNSAYSKGDIDLLEETIEQNFSINIDRYVKVNFYSFIDIVEAVGGIKIKISTEEAQGMWDPMGEQNNILGQKFTKDFLRKGGTYNLNGNQALGYARLRYVGNADWERTQRQRTVMEKIAEKASKLSLVELKSLMDKVLPDVKTDLTDAEIAYYLLNALDYLGYERQQLQIPADGTFTNETIRGMDVLSADLPSNIELLQKTIYGYTNISATAGSTDINTTTTTNNSGYNTFQ